MKVRSQVYPTTNIVPLDGGVVQVTDDGGLVDGSSLEYSVVEDVGSVVDLGGGVYHCQSEAAPDNMVWETNGSYDQIGGKQEISLSINGYEKLGIDDVGEPFANLGFGDRGVNAVETYAWYDSHVDEYKVLVAWYDALGSSGANFASAILSGVPFELVIIMRGDSDYDAGYRQNGEFVSMREGTVSDSIHSKFWKGVSSNKEAKISIGDIEVAPVLELPCKGDYKWARYRNSTGSTLTYDVYPAYPGVMQAVLWGTGDNLGQSEVAEIEFTGQPVAEDSMKFVLSPIEKLYDDATTDVRCRDSAVEQGDFQSGLRMHNECVCDGSLADQSEMYVEITGGTSDISKLRSKHKPAFIMEEPLNDGYGGVRRYGESFDFQRIHHDFNNSVTHTDVSTAGAYIKELRTLKLSDGGRVYYGVMVEELVTPKTIEFDYSPINSNDQWEIGRADDGTVIASGGGGIGPADQSLEEGLYYYTVHEANGGVYWNKTSGERLAYTPEMETRDSYVNDGVLDAKMFFEVKQYQGRMVALHYDRCNNLVTTHITDAKDVCMRSDSISAVETTDGNVAVLYEEFVDHDLWPGTGDEISYRVINLEADSVGGMNKLTLPSESFSGVSGDHRGIYAFDVVRVEEDGQDRVYFAANFRLDERGGGPLAPRLSEMSACAARLTEDSGDTSGFKFESGRDTIYGVLEGIENGNLDYYLPNTAPLENLYAYGLNGGPIFTEEYIDTSLNHGMDATTFGRVRMNYDSARENLVLAALSYRTRAPIVCRRRGYSMIPRHFDFYSGGYRNVGHDGQRFTNLKSLSACYGADGMLYTVAVRGAYPTAPSDFPARTSEIGVMDPDRELGDFRQHVYVSEEGFDMDETVYARFREPQFRFQAIPAFNLYQQSDGSAYGPETAEICLDDGYLVATLGMKTERTLNDYFPSIYQACTQDEMPFGVPLDEQWTPEYKGATDYQTANLTWTSSRPWPLMEDGTAVPSISRTLDPVSMRQYEAKTGYRFSTRVKKDSGAEGAYFANNFVFEARAVREHPDEGLYTTCNCRMVFNGQQIDCRVGDGNGGWESVGQICDVDQVAVNDLHIIVQHHDNVSGDTGTKFRAVFAVKNSNHPNDSGDTYDFLTAAEVQAGTGITEVSVSATSTEFSCFFDNNGDSSPYTVEMRQMGWGLLRAPGLLSEHFEWDDAFANGELVSESEAEADLGLGGSINPNGEKWRQFNDVALFNYSKGDPTYSFRTSERTHMSGLSDRYHWPNGFEFYFSGSPAVAGDRWKLDREVVSNTSDIQSELIHGYYTTKSDDGAVHIWADSEDSGLGDFEANTFIVSGTNVPEVTVVAKDALGDAWQEVGTIDLRKFELDSNLLTEVNHVDAGRSIVKVDSALIKEGRFSEFTHYLGGVAPLSDNRAGKITASFEDSVWVDTSGHDYSGRGFDFSTESAEIFVDRGALILEQAVRHRFVGIRIDPYHTAEGKFQINSFALGRPSVVPLQYGHDVGSGAVQEAEAETNFVFDEQPYTKKKYSLRKEFDLSYSLTDAKTLSKLQSVVREMGVARRPVWILENHEAHPEKIYQCFVEGGASYRPLVDEDGEKFYEFEVAFRSSE